MKTGSLIISWLKYCVRRVVVKYVHSAVDKKDKERDIGKRGRQRDTKRARET